MNVLSLFDGMSCGQLALQRAGIHYDNYYASEIDKYAMQITKKNFPDTIHIGNVTKVKGSDLPKIDLLIGGSPCQGFSFAGKMLNFEDPRSALFFEFVRLLHECKPKYLLLENVKMKKESELVITQALNCYPIEINSALVSAQNRRRLYWTNIGSTHTDLFGCVISGIEQPEDKGVFLKDIIEPEVDKKYLLGETAKKYLSRHYGNLQKPLSRKSKSLMANYSYGLCDKFLFADYKGAAARGRGDNNAKQIEVRQDGKSNSLTSHQMDSILFADYRNDEGLRIRDNGKAGAIRSMAGGPDRQGLVITHSLQPRNGKGKGGKGPLQKSDGKSYSLDTAAGQAIERFNSIRRLTPIECERLQTVPDNYTAGVSDSQRYKMLGNGWTVDVIAHIFKHLK